MRHYPNNRVSAFWTGLDLGLSPDSVLAVRDGGVSELSTYNTTVIRGYNAYLLTAAGRASQEISLQAFISFAAIVHIFERYDAKG